MRNRVILLAVSLYALLWLAACASTPTYAPPEPGFPEFYLSVPACAFNASNNETEFFRMNLLVHKGPGRYGHFLAPVYLPDGYVLKHIELLCIDAIGQMTIYLKLIRVNRVGRAEVIAETLSTGTTGTVRTFPGDVQPAKSLVNNNRFSYYLEAFFDNYHFDEYLLIRLNQAKIVYGPPEY